MVTAFWICIVLIVYPYVLYPAAIALWARFRPWHVTLAHSSISVTFVIAARDEGERIRQKVEELAEQLDVANVEGHVIVVLDGPTDGVELPQTVGCRRIETLYLPVSGGKALAITIGASRATTDILAFADVRQKWQRDALSLLLENFGDQRVGAVSGELVLQTAPGINSGVGMYWRFERWLRANEAIVDSVVGVTGAICAVRRSLFEGIPAGTILDDVYWPLQVAMSGFRIQHDRRALAFDCLPRRPRDEFLRKLRTLSGNFQLTQLLPVALLPWRNRIWFQYFSHKLARLVVPWALLCALIANTMIDEPGFRIFLWAQVFGYCALAFAALTNASRHSRLIAAGVSFAMLNLAAWLAFWVWLFGRASRSWKVVNYNEANGGHS